ncbi:hypothetical protein HDV04_006302 [Boothiomyces sp. JEL0838]|nr:hypothetical protein HDV04_006302 [Boothiomyces sp. JEL0838]
MAEKEISLSIEETNKLRISLGLKPLEEDKKEEREIKNLENYKKKEDKEKREKEIIERIHAEKKSVKFKGKTLGDTKDVDAIDWISKVGRKQNKKPKQQKQEKEEYTSEDLSGMKVAHDMDDLGHETVLVLKDTSVLDEGDELVNVNITDMERTRKNLEIKKGKKSYNVYEEYENQLNGIKRNILSNYNEEEENAGFTLMQGGQVNIKEMEKAKLKEEQELMGTVSLDYDKTVEIADYYTNEEMLAFRKPKKKKKKSSRKALETEANDEDVVMEPVVHEKYSNSNKTTNIEQANFVDDDELQSALSKVRASATKKRKFDITLVQPESDHEEETGGLIISEVSEFVNNISTEPIIEKKPKISEPKDVEMEFDEQELNQIQQEEEMPLPEVENHEILEDEPIVNTLAGTLALLAKKGDLEKATDEQIKRNQIEKERLQWLQEQRKKDAIRERELQKEKEEARKRNLALGEKGKRQHRGTLLLIKDDYDKVEKMREMERQRAQETIEKFKDYKPNVNLIYRDSAGRDLNPKEAFKELAHKFHGKKSGKNKMEKKLSRMQEEMLQKKMLNDSFTFQSNPEPTISEPEPQPEPIYVPQQPIVIEKPEPVKFEMVKPAEKPVEPERKKIAFGLGVKKKVNVASSFMKNQ